MAEKMKSDQIKEIQEFTAKASNGYLCSSNQREDRSKSRLPAIPACGGSHMEELALNISGMSCAGCVTSVRNALSRLPGVQVEQVEIGSARVAYNPSLASPESVRRAIVKAGFEPQES